MLQLHARGAFMMHQQQRWPQAWAPVTIPAWIITIMWPYTVMNWQLPHEAMARRPGQAGQVRIQPGRFSREYYAAQVFAEVLVKVAPLRSSVRYIVRILNDTLNCCVAAHRISAVITALLLSTNVVLWRPRNRRATIVVAAIEVVPVLQTRDRTTRKSSGSKQKLAATSALLSTAVRDCCRRTATVRRHPPLRRSSVYTPVQACWPSNCHSSILSCALPYNGDRTAEPVVYSEE